MPGPVPRSPLDRFFDHVAFDDCWIWTGGASRGRYGLFFTGRQDGRSVLALTHRYLYELAVGPIPSGLELDHLCGTPRCVNPDHLDPVTPQENIRRATVAGRLGTKPRAVCRRGHPMAGDNVVVHQTARGALRRCITCERFNRETFKAKALLDNPPVVLI